MAFERAVIDAWGEAWESIGLPPFLGDCWQGNAPLVYRAVESLVSRSEDARGYCRPGWLASCRGENGLGSADAYVWRLYAPPVGASEVAGGSRE